MSEGRGGHWNRAGRRSGGSRPFVVNLPRVADNGARYRCPDCSNDALPALVTTGCQMCRTIVELHDAGKLDALWADWVRDQTARPK